MHWRPWEYPLLLAFTDGPHSRCLIGLIRPRMDGTRTPLSACPAAADPGPVQYIA